MPLILITQLLNCSESVIPILFQREVPLSWPRRVIVLSGSNHRNIKDFRMASFTCQMNSCSPSQVSPHKLSQVVSGCFLPEPVHEPPWLMSHQDDLILWTHALLCYPCKIPVPTYRPMYGSVIFQLIAKSQWFKSKVYLDWIKCWSQSRCASEVCRTVRSRPTSLELCLQLNSMFAAPILNMQETKHMTSSWSTLSDPNCCRWASREICRSGLCWLGNAMSEKIPRKKVPALAHIDVVYKS